MRPIVTFLVISMLAFPCQAANWPQWRGPLGTGVSPETGLPVEWSRDQNIAWRAPLEGLGVSSPIVWGDRVFVTHQLGAGELRTGNHPSFIQGGGAAEAGELPLGGARPPKVDTRVAFAIAAYQTGDGKKLWEYRLDAEGDLPEVHEKRNLAAPTPLTDGERVYAWFSNRQLAALDITGRLVWSRHLGKEYSPFDLEWGHASSPTLYQESLILPCYQSSPHSCSRWTGARARSSGEWSARRARSLTARRC